MADPTDELMARATSRILVPVDDGDVPSSWTKPRRIGACAAGDAPRVEPALLARSDGRRLLYAGKVNELHGEPEAGKGFVGGIAVAETIAARGRVAIFDFDHDASSWAVRIAAGGIADPAVIDEGVDLFAIDAPLPIARHEGVRSLAPAAREALDRTVGLGHDLVVFDNVNAAIGIHGLEPERTADAVDFLRLFVGPFRAVGATMLLIDHVVKNAAVRGRWQSGSIHKMNALDGASFEVRVRKQPAPGRVGTVDLVVAKDRHGAVRSESVTVSGRELAGVVEIDGRGDRPVARVIAPSELDLSSPSSSFRPTGYMERVSRFLEIRAEPASVRAIREGVGGSKDYVGLALGSLMAEEFVSHEDGPRNADLYRSLRPFREADDEGAEGS